MRLRRLDLTRYGRFTDHSIDFGPRLLDRPDLHLVYGPNEAGKSTAFRALLDLLYGIEMQSPYDFLHSYATMRLGACLEIDGAERELVRVKHGQTLRDGLGQPVPETLLRGAVNGMDRQAYRSMFSLDDETLESGGESILASKGELGQMLFGSSAGLSDLPSALLGLRQEAEGFFRPGGHNTGLKDLKNRLVALKEQRDAIDTLASRYRQLVQERDQQAGQMEMVAAERRACQQRLEEIGRQLGALPTQATLTRQRAALAALADLGTAPAAWQAELPQLQRRIDDATTAVTLAQAALDEVTARLTACIQDPPALGLQDDLGLMHQLGARDQTAVLDLPNRWQQLQSVEAAVRACLLRLDRAEETHPERLLPDAVTAATLRRAIAAHATLTADVTHASEEHTVALRAHQAAVRAVAEAPSAVEPGAIEAALHAVRDSDHGPRSRDAARRERQHADTLADALTQLAPWSGGADALLALAVPSEVMVRTWLTGLDRSIQAAETARSAIERLAEAARAGAATDPAIVPALDIAALATLRGLREARWADLRRRLDAPSADAFEAAMRQDDQAAAARLDEARLSARQQELEQAALRATALRAAEQARLADASRAAAELRAKLDGAVDGIAADALPSWLAARQYALVQRTDLRQARGDVAAAAADAGRLHEALRIALAQAGLDTSTVGTVEALTALAEQTIQGAVASRQRRGRASDCAAALEQRAVALQQAQTALDAWGTAWQAALDRSWLRELGSDATPAVVNTLLDELAALAEPLRSRDDLAGRIRAMECDSQAHAHEVARLATLLGMEDAVTAEQARRIAERVAAATRAAATEADLRIAAQQARTVLTQAQIAAQAPQQQAQAMFAQLGVESLLAVGDALAEIGRRNQLRRDVDETGATLCTQLALSAVEEAVAALHGVESIALQAEQTALRPQAQALEDRLRTLHADKGRAEDAIAAVGGDDAVVRLETQRRLVLLEIEERALDHLRLRAGIAAADRALRAWREQHRSAMLDAASDAFRVITCGAYSGLGTQPDRGGDILVALHRHGGSKAATALSKGCRFQLYLALRAAGHREFARLRQPVPFVADDIMETFDDFRAEESLGVFAGMARVGQVIYLTHHKHLCDLAERKVPGVRIHELLPAA